MMIRVGDDDGWMMIYDHNQVGWSSSRKGTGIIGWASFTQKSRWEKVNFDYNDDFEKMTKAATTKVVRIIAVTAGINQTKEDA